MNDRAPATRELHARSAVRALVASEIREVANAGLGEPDILAFWFGEPDEVTPAYIRDTAAASLAAGETFYTLNFGIPELREAIAGYLSTLHRPVDTATIAVTASGMSALMLTVEALVDPGDRVVCVTPLWPNLTEIPKILGAEVVRVPLEFGRNGWALDLDRLMSALVPETRVLIVNSPNNPTGWTLDREAQAAILAHCRRHGIWIVSDDVYERLYYQDGDSKSICAPSFLDLADRDDRLVSTNSFSKAWLMTGWRLGWIVAPPALMPDLGKLIEYNTSCSPVFVQRAGVVAITQGEPVVAHTLSRFRSARDLLVRELASIDGIEVESPRGAMYVFFRVAGVADSLVFCKRLVRESRLGLAPGSAFGPEGQGFVRWCFAASEDRLAEGVRRLRRGMVSASTPSYDAAPRNSHSKRWK
ncbi:MAG TPA: pyridoxal phosphate-dependent aminotransferase [Casimicrobiaceae bacterium]|nr:pyridoxal phosphate-dependent aminotransferase [Casimicrobiaceae bacterium]